MDKLISVIVPIYNVEKYLRRCIDSVMMQTYKKIEIILVDDGSSDSCPEICDEYKKKDTRIKVIHKKNGGLSDARNKGIEFAKGDFISFIDSDDVISKTMIEYLYKNMIEYNADISVCNFKYFCNEEELMTLQNEYESNDVEKVYSNIEALEILLDGKKSYGDYAWNKLYKINLFNNVKYPYMKKMEDIGTTYKLYYKSNKIVIGTSIKYFYFQRADSILGKNDIQIYKDGLELSIERYLFLKEKGNIELDKFQDDLKIKIIELYKHCKKSEDYIFFYKNRYDGILYDLIKKKPKNSNCFKLKLKLIVYTLIIKINKYFKGVKNGF